MDCVITDVASADKFNFLRSSLTRIVCGGAAKGWLSYAESREGSTEVEPYGETRADDPFILYFTLGTTSKPKMVLHSQCSYRVRHLSTTYWLRRREGDVHLNISSPGWAEHAWRCFFAPWNVGATIFIYNQGGFISVGTLAALQRCGVDTLCAPPTAWRSLILQDLAAYKMSLRELTSAGEPLNPEVILQVKAAWGPKIREGFGQTETIAILGNPHNYKENLS